MSGDVSLFSLLRSFQAAEISKRFNDGEGWGLQPQGPQSQAASARSVGGQSSSTPQNTGSQAQNNSQGTGQGQNAGPNTAIGAPPTGDAGRGVTLPPGQALGIAAPSVQEGQRLDGHLATGKSGYGQTEAQPGKSTAHTLHSLSPPRSLMGLAEALAAIRSNAPTSNVPVSTTGTAAASIGQGNQAAGSGVGQGVHAGAGATTQPAVSPNPTTQSQPAQSVAPGNSGSSGLMAPPDGRGASALPPSAAGPSNTVPSLPATPSPGAGANPPNAGGLAGQPQPGLPPGQLPGGTAGAGLAGGILAGSGGMGQGQNPGATSGVPFVADTQAANVARGLSHGAPAGLAQAQAQAQALPPGQNTAASTASAGSARSAAAIADRGLTSVVVNSAAPVALPETTPAVLRAAVHVLISAEVAGQSQAAFSFEARAAAAAVILNAAMMPGWPFPSSMVRDGPRYEPGMLKALGEQIAKMSPEELAEYLAKIGGDFKLLRKLRRLLKEIDGVEAETAMGFLAMLGAALTQIVQALKLPLAMPQEELAVMSEEPIGERSNRPTGGRRRLKI